MGRSSYTPEQKAEAVEAAMATSLREASRTLGILPQTIHGWLSEEQKAELRRARRKTQEAIDARLTAIEAERVALAEALIDDIGFLRDELFAPCVEHKALVVSDGAQVGSRVEVVEIRRDQPTFTEQKAIMTTLAIAVDKVQILTGKATERIDFGGDSRQRATELLDELAARRDAKAQAS